MHVFVAPVSQSALAVVGVGRGVGAIRRIVGGRYLNVGRDSIPSLP